MIPGWRFLAAVAAELGSDLTPESPAEVFDELSKEVPFYDSITYEEIGGTGLRWGDRDPGHVVDARRGRRRGRPRGPSPIGGEVVGHLRADGVRSEPAAAPDGGTARARDVPGPVGGRRHQAKPALRFLMPKQKLELAAKDAESLELANGDEVTVAVNGHSVEATVAIRDRMSAGRGLPDRGHR